MSDKINSIINNTFAHAAKPPDFYMQIMWRRSGNVDKDYVIHLAAVGVLDSNLQNIQHCIKHQPILAIA